MNIAIVRKKYTFHGGSESFSQQFIEHLAGEGHRVHVFASEWEVTGAHENVVFHKLPTLPLNSTARDLSFAVSAWLALRGGKFDVIQTHDKTLRQDVYRAGDGCHIEWLRQRWKRTGPGGKFSILLNPYHWLVLALERMILKGHRFKKIIAISDLVKNDIIDNYGVRESEIEVIYNGVDLERFHPRNRAPYRARIREEFSIGSGEAVALFVGSGFERKGVRFLLEALDLVPEPLTVLIVGKGRKIRHEDTHNNKRVLFLGPRRDIHMFYAAADMFVFPALYEPFGNVHLEALASGLPVITTAATGGSEILKHGEDGFVVPAPEDTAAIAGAISRLIQGETRERMSEAARKKAEAFTFKRHIKQVTDLYDKVLSDI
jgi:UDP-glucose:(heptosyl)LPS alpha-1,3-glucosyltransferase